LAPKWPTADYQSWAKPAQNGTFFGREVAVVACRPDASGGSSGARMTGNLTASIKFVRAVHGRPQELCRQPLPAPRRRALFRKILDLRARRAIRYGDGSIPKARGP